MHSSYPFCDINTFEKYVLQYNPKHSNFYVLSNNFAFKSKSFSKLSIFDNIKSGKIKEDKVKVDKILNILIKYDNLEEKKKIIKGIRC
jgi:hypothetical protein